MDFDHGFDKLKSALLGAGLGSNDEQYLSLMVWHHQLRASVENERLYAVLGPQELENRERILKELDRLALRYSGKSFRALCGRQDASGEQPGDPRSSGRPSQNTSDSERGFVDGCALLIGVGDYANPRLTNLPATERDAQALAAALTDTKLCGYDKGNVEVILGRQATKKAVLVALERLANKAKHHPTVFVFFSGHGARMLECGVWRTYLCPREADPDHLTDTAIGGDEFSNLLACVSCQKMLVILDACHAGGSANLKDAVGRTIWKSGFSNDYYEALSQGNGRVVIASSQADQLSFVRPGGDMSLFTWHLCQALGGRAGVRGDGLIHVLDVFHYVNEKVRSDQPAQVPTLKVKDLDLNFPIALDQGGKVAYCPATERTPISHIRERIVRDPVGGAKALSDYLVTCQEWAGKRDDVDLKRAEMVRIQREMDLFGPNDSDKAAINRIVYFLLRVCKEMEGAS